MIEKVWAIWITGVLQPSLPQDILVDLGLTERPALVTRAFDLLVQPRTSPTGCWRQGPR